jgi:hypothetical protein
MPISKHDLKMMTDNELFNGMTLMRDDGDGLNEMVDELARRAGDLSVSDYLSLRACSGVIEPYLPMITNRLGPFRPLPFGR